MKKIFKFIAVAVATIILTTVLVSATTAAFAEQTITVSSESHPGLSCTLAMSQAESVFMMLPSDVQDRCRSEYSTISARCRKTPSFKYQGVAISTSQTGDFVELTFSYGGYELKVSNTTWEHLDKMFSK